MANDVQTETFSLRAESYGPDGIMDLRKGYCGKIVVEMQCLLRFLGYNVESTSEYDDKTAFAVTNFQKDAGLPLTGIIDYATRMALKDMYLANKHAADIELGVDNARAARRGEMKAAIRDDLAQGSTSAAETFLSAAMNDPEKFEEDFGFSEGVMVELYSLATGHYSNQNEAAKAKLDNMGFGQGGLPEPKAVADEDFKKELGQFILTLLTHERLVEFLNAASARGDFLPLIKNQAAWDDPAIAAMVPFAQQLIEEHKKAMPPERKEPPISTNDPVAPTPVEPVEPVPVKPTPVQPAAPTQSGNLLVMGGITLLVVYALFRGTLDRKRATPPTLQGYMSPLPPPDEDEEEDDEDEE